MTRKKCINDIKKFIENKGGKLLTFKYVNNNSPLTIICAYKHIWTSSWKILNKGSWCKECAYSSPKKYNNPIYLSSQLLKAKKYAKAQNGTCLSIIYKNNRLPLSWECCKGHTWKSSFHNVVNGKSWCPKCVSENFITIDDLKKIAKSRGGKCLSQIRSGKKLEWECTFGHKWKASVGNIVHRNSWCPECSAGLYENICRLYFEKLFRKSFPKSYPKWLVNNKGNRLELDGYCEELRLAFEHNGMQHYINNSFFGNYEKIKLHDKIKKDLCAKHGVCLIVIPELFSLTKITELESFIIGNIPSNFKYYNTNIDPYDIYVKSKNKIHHFIPIIEHMGGKCISQIYSGGRAKIKIMCRNNHIFKITSAQLKKGQWCSKCAVLKRTNTIQDANNLAKIKDGCCLSDKYINNYTKLKWKCNYNHIWDATYNTIQNGCWCPICAKKVAANSRRLNLKVYQDAAKKKGGICLSTQYNHCHDKLKWKCNKGHIWMARGDQIKNTNQWCPFCYKNK